MYYFTKEGLKLAKNNLIELDEQYKKDILEICAERDTNVEESNSFLFSRVELANKYEYKKNSILDKINKAVLIENTNDYKNWDGSSVIMKSEVKIDFDGEEETYTILGEGEANPNEYIISYESDLAKALLGHKIGEVIPFRGFNITILDVKKIENVKKLILK